jgi:hypothetical protein
MRLAVKFSSLITMFIYLIKQFEIHVRFIFEWVLHRVVDESVHYLYVHLETGFC